MAATTWAPSPTADATRLTGADIADREGACETGLERMAVFAHPRPDEALSFGTYPAFNGWFYVAVLVTMEDWWPAFPLGAGHFPYQTTLDLWANA